MKVILEHQMSVKIIFKVEDVIGRDCLHITTHHVKFIESLTNKNLYSE